MPHIYLDHNATTPILPEVAAAMQACQAEIFANPSSQHAPGRKARQVLEDAREGIAALLGAETQSRPADSVIFTSGGTESNNLAILGFAGPRPCRIVLSAIEHPSVSRAGEMLQSRGYDVAVLGVRASGEIDPAELESLLSPETRLVSVMLGNNETGVLQPVRELSAICQRRGVPLHTDASQVVGKLPVDFRDLCVSAMTVAAHKFHGPRGVGALILRRGMTLPALFAGGVQQSGVRPGTEPVALAVGMHAALRHWHSERDARLERMTRLRQKLENALLAGVPGAIVHGRDAPRLPHTIGIAFPGINRQALVMALDLAGVACSSGSACASGSTDPSPTLLAMHCSADVCESSIRFSLGATTTESEIDRAAQIVVDVCRRMKNA